MIASWGAEVKSPAQGPAAEVWGTLGQYECAGELNSAPYFVRTDDGAVPRLSVQRCPDRAESWVLAWVS